MEIPPNQPTKTYITIDKKLCQSPAGIALDKNGANLKNIAQNINTPIEHTKPPIPQTIAFVPANIQPPIYQIFPIPMLLFVLQGS